MTEQIKYKNVTYFASVSLTSTSPSHPSRRRPRVSGPKRRPGLVPRFCCLVSVFSFNRVSLLKVKKDVLIVATLNRKSTTGL
jgi:hypothetical protein